MNPPENSPEAHEDEFQADLRVTENFYQPAPANLQLESLDPTEQMLEESEHREIEVPQVPEIPEPVIEEPAPVMNQSPPMQREYQKWEDWIDIEQAVAFTPWRIDEEQSDYESRDEIESAQPIDEVIAPAPKPPEVPPKIFLTFTRVRNFAIGAGVAIFLIQILLFMNWPLRSKKTPLQTKAIQAPVQETRPVIQHQNLLQQNRNRKLKFKKNLRPHQNPNRKLLLPPGPFRLNLRKNRQRSNMKARKVSLHQFHLKQSGNHRK